MPGRIASPLRRRRIVESVLFVFAFVVLLDALFGETGLVGMMRTSEETRVLSTSVRRTIEENARLKLKIERLQANDPAMLEDLARELGMIKPGEKVFKIREVKPAEP